MKVKDCYSLNVSEILGDVPTSIDVPAQLDRGISVSFVYGNYSESLNIFEAFANYLVERNRTSDMAKQIAAAESALDARNEEARRQSEIILDNYAERLQKFLDTERDKLKLETQRIELESEERVQQIQDAREREHARFKSLVSSLENYRSFLDEASKFLSEFESNPEKFLTRKKIYYQVKEDCRIKMKWITNLLKQIDYL